MIPHNPRTHTNETIHVANWLLHTGQGQAEYAAAREESNEIVADEETVEALAWNLGDLLSETVNSIPGADELKMHGGYFSEGYSDGNIYSDNPALRLVLPMIGEALRKVDLTAVARLFIARMAATKSAETAAA
jgi:hypothetical protein